MDRDEKTAEELYLQSLERSDYGNFDAALNLIEEALTLNSSSAMYLTTKAQYLLDLDRLEEARQTAQSALDIQPAAKTWATLGTIYARLGESEEAAESFERAIRIREDFNHYTLLAAAQADFDLQAARVSAERALELNDKWDEAWEILGIVHQRAKEHRKAVKYFQRAIEIDPLPTYLVSMALSQIEFDLAKAIETAKRMLEIDPGNEDAGIIIRAAEERQGKI